MHHTMVPSKMACACEPFGKTDGAPGWSAGSAIRAFAVDMLCIPL